jgi:hypothetical protein
MSPPFSASVQFTEFKTIAAALLLPGVPPGSEAVTRPDITSSTQIPLNLLW